MLALMFDGDTLLIIVMVTHILLHLSLHNVLSYRRRQTSALPYICRAASPQRISVGMGGFSLEVDPSLSLSLYIYIYISM